jgi:hypothetical protein
VNSWPIIGGIKIKKYLLALTPFVGCTILSIIFAIKQRKEYPHPSYPYQTEGPLAFFSGG